MGNTHYQTLEVEPSASPSVITAAYRALMKDNHPDTNSGHEASAAQIAEAYRILGNPNLRKKYDMLFIGGKYKLIQKIASGAFGTTYKAEHLEIPGAMVCIKQASEISDEDEEILQREARAMWDLRHYAIPAIRDFLRLPDGSVALVMSYIDGPNLFDLVEQYGPIEPEDVAWITERILNALSYMHGHGIVHGDIKPPNIIVQAESHMISVVDFGTAAIKPTDQGGSTGYTEYFSPPEARRVDLPQLPESDLYSVGATMLYALSGDLNAVLERKVPSTVPDPMCDFIKRLMRKLPLQRPNWQTEDLQETIVQIRETVFGRRRSGMKPIRHLPRQTTTRR